MKLQEYVASTAIRLSAKLTEAQVREIRKDHEENETSAIVYARRYGVSLSCIYSVINRESWRHVR